MYRLFTIISIGYLSLTGVFGQTADSTSSADDVFGRQLARTLRYPDIARRQGAVGQVYASFTVTSQGKLDQLTVLAMSDLNPEFRRVVFNALAKLPQQSPNLAGTYLLPVVFELEGRDGMKKPADDERQQVRQQAKQLVLSEVHVVAYSD